MKNIRFYILLLCLWSFIHKHISVYGNSISPYQIIYTDSTTLKTEHHIQEVSRAVIAPNIDGDMNDPTWKENTWHFLDQKWEGSMYKFDDFFGRYKMAWTPDALYVLVEIKDDILYNPNTNPLASWSNDDNIVLFIDHDNSGGDYQNSTNAFRYHITLDGNVVSFNTQQEPILRNHHITSSRTTHGDVSVWEFKITGYDDTYKERLPNDTLHFVANQKLGFSIAYIDNDHSVTRENYIGSVFISNVEKNQSHSNANAFGTIILKE